MAPPAERSGVPPTSRAGLVALAAVACLAFLACLRELWVADYWWQYRTGQWVLEHGWPTVDVFSYTAAGRPWIEPRWLFCVVQAALSDALGREWLAPLVWLAVAGAFGGVALPFVRRAGLGTSALVLALALAASSGRFAVRPELVSWLFVAIFTLVLDRWRARPTRLVWLLPALQVVWTNAHTLFVLGPVIVALAAACEIAAPGRSAQRTLEAGGLLGWTVLATLVNPWGWRGASFPLRLLGEIRGGSLFDRVVEEFRSPLELDPWSPARVAWFALIALAVVTSLASLRRLDPFRAALAAVQLWLSFLAVRNLPLFALAAVPLVLGNLAHGPPRAARPRRALDTASAVAALALALAGSWLVVTDRLREVRHGGPRFGLGVAEHRFPIAAAEFVEAGDFGGRVLSTMREGSYLLSRGHQVFIDPRLEVYGEALVERYVAVLLEPSAFAAAVREFDVRVVVCDLQSNLARSAVRDPDWRLAFFDTAAAVFVRRDALGGQPAIGSEGELARALDRARAALPAATPPGGPWARVLPAQPYLALADFLLILNRPREAAALVDDAARVAPGLEGLELRRATIAELAGDWERVISDARAGLERTPDDPRLVTKLGEAYYRTGRHAEARSWLERAVLARPDRAGTQAMLGSVLAAADELEASERHLRRAVELDPARGDYLANLARVQARRGATDEALAGLARAATLAPDDVTLLRDLAVLHARAGRPAEARVWLERGLALDPREPTLLSLADSLR